MILVPPIIASLLYFLRSSQGAFPILKQDVRRGWQRTRGLFRMAWSTPLAILVAMLFGITSLPVLITFCALNILSHVFLIEMDHTNFDLPYVDWAPRFISMILFAASIVFMVAVGFDSLELRLLPMMTRYVLIGYLFVQIVFYAEAVIHYGGYGRWKKLEYSDNAFSLNDIMIHLIMLVLFLSMLANSTN